MGSVQVCLAGAKPRARQRSGPKAAPATDGRARRPRSPVAPAVPSFYLRVYACVRLIPKGRIATYGAVATWLGSPRAARAVGYALAARLPPDVPWHRVVNRLGEISVGGAVWRPEEQRRRLEREKVVFDEAGAIGVRTYAFTPTAAQLRRAVAAAGRDSLAKPERTR